MDIKDIFDGLLKLGRSNNFDKIAVIHGAGDHAAVCELASRYKRDVIDYVSQLSQPDQIAFIKAIATYEDTVGAIGSVTSLFYLMPMVQDYEEVLLDWVLRNTDSYWWYGHEAKSLVEYREICRRKKEYREESLRLEAEREYAAKARAAERATYNLYNAVRRGDIKAVKALMEKGADAAAAKSPEGISVLKLAKLNKRQDIVEALSEYSNDEPI